MRGGNFLSLLMLCMALAYSQGFDYCTVNCGNVEHTMCTHQSENPGPLCINYENHLLTAHEKKGILDKHNELRSQVARGDVPNHPKALDMVDLAWNDEAELIARRWALQCNFAHDKCRVLSDKTYAGQNLAISGTNSFQGNELSQVQMWFDEHKLYTPKAGNLYPQDDGHKVGHYTQLVWAKTTHVGCERVFFKYAKFPNSGSEYLVCVYSPGGNVLGERVYEALGVQHECCVFVLLVSLVLALKSTFFTFSL